MARLVRDREEAEAGPHMLIWDRGPGELRSGETIPGA
jgi:hypothetical protein